MKMMPSKKQQDLGVRPPFTGTCQGSLSSHPFMISVAAKITPHGCVIQLIVKMYTTQALEEHSIQSYLQVRNLF